MDFYAYLLRCSDGSYYAGHTDDLDARIAQHQTGAVPGYTEKRRPVELVWSERFPDRHQAFAAERRIKGWTRAKKEALICGDWEALHRLAKKSFDTPLRLRSAATQDERENKVLLDPLILNSGLSEAEDHVSKGPAIVLVRPQLGENIGKAARAMLNFGLTDLRLVSPRDGWPNPSAGPAASGADVVLERAQVFETVAEAVADCPFVYATTVRKRGLVVPVVTPQEAAAEMAQRGEASAILFGAERSGLETEEVAIAQKILTVPINPEFRSLNLAQAVILVAYEWSKHQELMVPTEGEPAEPRAPHEHLEGLIGQLNEALDEVGYFFPPDRTPATLNTIRTILTKPGWSTREIQALRGMIRAITHPRQRGRSSNRSNS
ncbi:MAG TPA: TrmH family RNA methyltransferase [Allosphingosinicella sp.]